MIRGGRGDDDESGVHHVEEQTSAMASAGMASTSSMSKGGVHNVSERGVHNVGESAGGVVHEVKVGIQDMG